MAAKVITIHVRGVRPLLANNPAQMRRGEVQRGKKIPEPEEEAQSGLYLADGGHTGICTEAFRNCVVSAGKAFRKGRQSMFGLLSHLMNVDEVTALTTPEGKPATWQIDSRRAVVQRQGIIRSRPRYDEWEARPRLLFDDEMCDAGLIVKCAEHGGRHNGVGNYRGEKGGPMGRFVVVGHEVEDAS